MVKRDSLLAHTIARAVIAHVGGIEAAKAKWGDPPEIGKWDALAVAARATPKAVQVATFIITWATAWQLREDKSAALGIEAYSREGFESRRSAYRRLADFRELWPEYDDPQPLADLIAAEVERRRDARPTVALELELPTLA